MALTGKKYEKFYKETGSGDDKITAANKDYIKTAFEFGASHGFHDIMDDPKLGSLVYMIQQMQDELDYLRTEISANKDKTGITSSQANAITANTAKTGITLGEQRDIANNKTNVANNVTEITKLTRGKLTLSSLPPVQSGVEQAVECGVVYDSKAKTYSMVFVYSEITPPPKGGKATIVTRTGSIQLK
tara:strand:- start:91 stop:654 length:564 start_codon:yes stop_codon:yes gene_type:complete